MWVALLDLTSWQIQRHRMGTRPTAKPTTVTGPQKTKNGVWGAMAGPLVQLVCVPDPDRTLLARFMLVAARTLAIGVHWPLLRMAAPCSAGGRGCWLAAGCAHQPSSPAPGQNSKFFIFYLFYKDPMIWNNTRLNLFNSRKNSSPWYKEVFEILVEKLIPATI